MNLKNYELIYGKVNDLTGIGYSLMETITNLTKRVETLERENVETTNRLYELENKIDLMEN
jgi:prefoldin subunit 5